MSATAFQRLRREQANKTIKEVKETGDSTLSNKELKALLDEKGIKYDSKAKKNELVNLLNESSEEPAENKVPADEKENTDNQKLEGAE